jgi:hypothetical protein
MSHASTTEVRAGAWGLLAGLVGSLCCIGPSAAVLLGLGSSSALLGLSLDQTVARAGGGALLLAGAALALRRPRACDLRAGARWRTPALMLATFALAYGLLGLLLPELAARQVERAEAPAPLAQQADIALVATAASPRRLTLIIEKMECPPCASHVRSALKQKPYVRGFFAESGIEHVTIDYDSRQITAEQLARLFPGKYGVTVVSDEALP